MNHRATIRLLPDGRRMHLNDGPIDLIIGADGSPSEVRRAYDAASKGFLTVLDELCSELTLIRRRIGQHSPLPSGRIAQCMFEAAFPFHNRCFITPMVAVAGSVAESILSSMVQAANLRRAYVNNGGDIALHIGPGESYIIGMVERPDQLSLFGSVEIREATPVRGIATSGWRGRSFSLGIADAVTVVSATAAKADAAATIIANAVDLPDHPSITRVPACEIAPDSDLLDLPVTRAVKVLSKKDIAEALEAGAAVAEELRAQDLIHAAALCLQGQVRLVSEPRTISFLPNITQISEHLSCLT